MFLACPIAVLARMLISMVFLAALTGCFFGGKKENCKKSQEYQASTSVEKIAVPEDLDAPDQSSALYIPVVGDAVPESPPDTPCLDQPPDFFWRQAN
jgi:uncharacterized lipoprotein